MVKTEIHSIDTHLVEVIPDILYREYLLSLVSVVFERVTSQVACHPAFQQSLELDSREDIRILAEFLLEVDVHVTHHVKKFLLSDAIGYSLGRISICTNTCCKFVIVFVKRTYFDISVNYHTLGRGTTDVECLVEQKLITHLNG